MGDLISFYHNFDIEDLILWFEDSNLYNIVSYNFSSMTSNL